MPVVLLQQKEAGKRKYQVNSHYEYWLSESLPKTFINKGIHAHFSMIKLFDQPDGPRV